jgi:hypothetical protein
MNQETVTRDLETLPAESATMDSAEADVEESVAEADVAEPEPETRAPTISITKVRSVMLIPGAPPQPAAQPHLQLASLSPASTAPSTTAATQARGTPPSTLQQQAERLARWQPPVAATEPTPSAPPSRSAVAPAAGQSPFRLKGPEASASTLTVPGDFQIQIGAYSSAAEAERALAATRDRANDLLSGAAPATAPVQKGNRQLYRARFGGFSETLAANTCGELRRRQIDCFVLRPE